MAQTPIRDLWVGRLGLPTVAAPVGEQLGSEVSSVGDSTAVGQRRVKGFSLVFPIHGTTGDVNPYEAGASMRRRLRSIMQNHAYRLNGLYVRMLWDPERNGWVVLGTANLADKDGGPTFAEYELTIDQAYRVGAPNTHREGFRVDLTDRRLATSPIDYNGDVVNTSGLFAGMNTFQLCALPTGVSDISVRGLMLPTTSLVGQDGTVPRVTGRSTGDVVTWERPDTSFNLNDVTVYDRGGSTRALTYFGHQVGVACQAAMAANWARVDSDPRSVANAAVSYQTGAGYDGGFGLVLQTVSSALVGTNPAAAQLPRYSVLHYGLVDLALLGAANLTPFTNAMRVAISRLSAVAVFEDSDASVAYSGPNTSTGLTTANSGSTVVSMTATTTATLTVPATFPGGTIALGTLGLANPSVAGSATWTVTVDGVAAGMYATSQALHAGSGSTYAPYVYRLQGLAAGAHTIVLTPGTITGTYTPYFDYWQVEAQAPRKIIVPQQYYLTAAGYATFNAYPFPPTDSGVNALNRALALTLAAEFGNVRAPALDLAKVPANYTNGVIPSAAGVTSLVAQIAANVVAVEEFYGGDFPYSAGDVPVIANGLCQVRYDPTNTPGFKVDTFDPANATAPLYTEQFKVLVQRRNQAGGGNNYCDTLLSASVLEYTTDRCVVQANMRASADPTSRERVLLTLQRGWQAPRVEVYAAPATAAVAVDAGILYTTTLVDTNNALARFDSGTFSTIDTAGSGSALFTGATLGSGFSGENWVVLARAGQTLDSLFAVLQAASVQGVTSAAAYGGAARNAVLIFSTGQAGYFGEFFGYGTHRVSDQALEAEAIRNTGSATTSQVADATASGGLVVKDTQTANTNRTLTKATTNLVQAKYRIAIRARIDNAGTLGQFVATLGGVSGPTVATSSTTLVWLDLGDILAPAAAGTLTVSGWAGTTTYLLPPTGLTVTDILSGGNLQYPNAYYWTVTARNANGQTTGSNEVFLNPAGNYNDSATLSWNAVAGATSYRIYRALVSGGETTSPVLVATVGSTVLSYTDLGNATTAGAAPTTNTASVTTVGNTYIDRVEMVRVEDRTAPGAAYGAARDFGSAYLLDQQVQTRRIARG